MSLSKQDILNRIGYFRNKKNMSAYELGMILGHSKGYFYRIEHGEISLSVEMLLDILKILNVSTEEFFYEDLQNYQRDKSSINMCNGLTQQEIDSLKIILKRK